MLTPRNRLVQHHLGGGRGGDIAVADDWNTFDGLRGRADARQIDRAAKALLARAAMPKMAATPASSSTRASSGAVQVLIVPSQPHFGGDGNFHGVHHAADQLGVFSHSVIMAELRRTRQTLRAGQPMLMINREMQ